MSKAGVVSTGSAKCFILFMATVILLQGCLYLGLSLWGLTMTKCSQVVSNVAENPFGFAMDLIYFTDKKCGTRIITVEGKEVPIDINWSKSYEVTHRMYAVLIAYAAVSGAWIVTSLLVAGATLCGPFSRAGTAWIFWPWALTVIGGSILDVTATVFNAVDIAHTMSVSQTFDYIGVTVPQEVMEGLQNFDAYFVTPAVIMTILSCRVVIIWFLNIYGVSFSVSFSNILWKDKFKTISSGPLSQAQQAPCCASTPQRANGEPFPAQIQPKPLRVQTPPPAPRENSVQSPIAVWPPSAPSPEVIQTTIVSDVVTYRNTETHPDKLDYPSQRSPEAQPVAPELSAISPLNNRYASAEGFQYPAQNSSQRVSAELRGQLPWSYTSAQAKPQPPRKQQSKVYPDIPEPDYAAYASRNERRPSNTATDANPQQSYSRW